VVDGGLNTGLGEGAALNSEVVLVGAWLNKPLLGAVVAVEPNNGEVDDRVWPNCGVETLPPNPVVEALPNN